MSLAHDFKIYQEEIELIRVQTRVECDLYSIIACVIRERENSKDISLREVSQRRKTQFSEKMWGDSGFADFVILERNQKFDKPYGAIEVKTMIKNLNDNSQQLKNHLDFYKKVIYTNGLKWRYYEVDNLPKPVWECELGELCRNEKWNERSRVEVQISNEKIHWNSEESWEKLLDGLEKINWR
ncbi:hypothetical protein R6U77_12380 [Lysinibacillus louembei]|uniref:Uncharacterized protein n=1 Tax=Lysinibacillus louembei TaxID=1470088 RepID=A0ABZ0RTD5_9BACI|nr:hypothetical protein [Lysinibacillus louembei]WPK10679.1 hypothetical protein R6U77_12380 [Lysinibacillus louembei]